MHLSTLPCIDRRRFLVGAGATIAAPRLSMAQAYPNRTIRVIVPFAAGGPSDIIARIVADALQPRLGQSVVIENRAGGGANIGIGQAARADPDGYTLLITTSAFVINPSLYKKIPFDPIKDFAPICDLAVSPQMLSVRPGYVNTLAEFIAKAKEADGKLNYASPGLGTQAQLTVELLKLRAGIALTHVPFTGGPPAVQALLSKSVELVTNSVPTSDKLVHAGTLHALAVSGKTRWFSLPKVPNLVESGFPGFVTDTFVGMFAPIATPKDIVERLAAETLAALKHPEVVARARGAGFEVTAGAPAALARRVVEEVALNRDIVQKAGIEPR
ncbi:MAG: tripartite tricarboxylate transporter substrate binding protein [Hyphomicrobiales bacterium]|nr:tripartite tricarboxylate transporter substrate binding protein [Hyphomicrobiales bacterium]